ncbi:MAG: hypothetical protein WD960_14220 [Gemmatimonadota bacterium]
MTRSLRTAAGLGVATGLRSIQGLAWISRTLAGRRPARGAGHLERILSHDLVAGTLALAAVGELAVDKHPSIPARIQPSALLARAAAGAAVGSVSVGRHRQLLGAVTGAGCAVAGAYAGWFLRRAAGRVTLLPDIAVALAEDALAISLASRLARS